MLNKSFLTRPAPGAYRNRRSGRKAHPRDPASVGGAPRPRRLLRRRPERASRDRLRGGAPDRSPPRPRAGRLGPRYAAGRGSHGGPPGRPAITTRDVHARPRADTTARDRRRGRGVGVVDQLGTGGLARRLRRCQRRWRLAAQHRGRGVRGDPGLLLDVRRRTGPRPGHGAQPRGPARAPPVACLALGCGQHLPRRARRRQPRQGHGVPGRVHLGRRSAAPGERLAGRQGPVTGPLPGAPSHRGHASPVERPPGRAGTGPHPQPSGLPEGRGRVRGRPCGDRATSPENSPRGWKKAAPRGITVVRSNV